jgi:hypothetical protein
MSTGAEGGQEDRRVDTKDSLAAVGRQDMVMEATIFLL